MIDIDNFKQFMTGTAITGRSGAEAGGPQLTMSAGRQ